MNKQKNNGITLIALVITIVVLVILVGVSVSVAINTGLITNSKKAVANYDKAQTDEKSQISEVEDLVAGYSSKDIMASKVTPANYGNTVTGYIDIDNDENTDDWQIFSVEGNNVWLISKDYVQLDETTLKNVGMTAEEYYVCWDKAPDYGKTYDNANCVASLTDSSKWIAYVDKDLALKAMGGPTIEMFAKSYNAKYPSKTIEYKKVTTEDNEGYQVKWSTQIGFDYWISELETNNNPYVITTTQEDGGKAYGYWVASASAYEYDRVMVVFGKGSFDNDQHTMIGWRCIWMSTCSLFEI